MGEFFGGITMKNAFNMALAEETDGRDAFQHIRADKGRAGFNNGWSSVVGRHGEIRRYGCISDDLYPPSGEKKKERLVYFNTRTLGLSDPFG